MGSEALTAAENPAPSTSAVVGRLIAAINDPRSLLRLLSHATSPVGSSNAAASTSESILSPDPSVITPTMSIDNALFGEKADHRVLDTATTWLTGHARL